MKRALIIGVGLALASAGLAMAQTAAQNAPGDYAGHWTLSGVSEGAEVCDVTLTADEAIGGWAVALASDCQKKFNLSDDIAAWTVLQNGSIGFIDAVRHVVLRFAPADIGGYIATPQGSEPIALDRAVATPELTEQQRMSGSWSFNALCGAPVCAVTLTSAADGLSGTVKKRGACHAPWTRTDFSTWKRKAGKIALLDHKGKVITRLGGDSLGGFTGDFGGVFVGLVRDWDVH